jgi:proteasome accessory factor B
VDRTERLLHLVALLLGASEPVPFSEIREAFPDDYGGGREAAERKLERDKAELLQIGVPVEFVEAGEDRELGGYRIDRGAFFLRDPKLTPEELAALYAAGSAALAIGPDGLPRSADFPFAQDLELALRKIAVAGGSGRRAQGAGGAAAARGLLVVRPGDPARAGKLKVLSDAVARRKRVRIAYRNAAVFERDAQRTERWVRPYGLAFRGGAWRLVGHCELRDAPRTFVVDRIEQLEVNTAHPNSADFEIPTGFDAGAAAGQQPWQWAQGSEAMDVSLRFAPGSELLAERAFEVQPQPLPEGGARARVRVSFLDGLVRHVLSFGDRVWIEGPAEARDRARAALDALAALHAGEPHAAQAGAAEAADLPDKGRRDSNPPPLARRSPRERLRRLLLVVPAARRRPNVTIDELAHELGLDPAELRSDIDLLSMVGVPPFSPDDLIDISVDDAGRVTVALDQSFSQPPQLTGLEALALAAAAQESAQGEPAVASALTKLTDQLQPAAQKLYAALARRVVASAPPPKGTEAILASLRAATDKRLEVVLEYDKEGRGAAEERPLRPLALLDHGGRYYVVGHDLVRDAERTFRLDRIRGVRETTRLFADPGPLDLTRFQRPELFFPSGAETPARLRFSPGAAPWALSRYADRATPLLDGGAEVVVDSAGSAWATSLALSFAGGIEVVGPAPARAATRDEIEKARARYAGSA